LSKGQDCLFDLRFAVEPRIAVIGLPRLCADAPPATGQLRSSPAVGLAALEVMQNVASDRGVSKATMTPQQFNALRRLLESLDKHPAGFRRLLLLFLVHWSVSLAGLILNVLGRI